MCIFQDRPQKAAVREGARPWTDSNGACVFRISREIPTYDPVSGLAPRLGVEWDWRRFARLKLTPGDSGVELSPSDASPTTYPQARGATHGTCSRHRPRNHQLRRLRS